MTGPRLAGVRIALVEDHALLVQSLRLALHAEGADLLPVSLDDATSLVAACIRLAPDVVLLDLDLGPDVGDGARLVAPLVASHLRVLLLTGCTDPARLGGCLLDGALGLVDKTEELEQLVEQVAAAVRGDPSSRRRLELRAAARRERAATERRQALFASLTARESQVLDQLVQGHGVEEISRRLVLSDTTVRTHVRGVLQKLGVRSQLAAAGLARAHGWPDPAARDLAAPDLHASWR